MCNYWEEEYWLVRGALVCVFVWFWDGDYVGQLPYMWYYVGVKSSYQHAREDASPKRHMCFKCLMFSLAGPSEL